MKRQFTFSFLSKSFLFGGLFLFTLVNFPLMNHIYGMILIVLYFLIEKIQLKKKAFSESLLLLLLLSISIMRFQIFLIDEVNIIFIDAFYGNSAKYVLGVFVWFFIRSLVLHSTFRNDLFKILPWILRMHVYFFFFQFFVHRITGYYVDFMKFTQNISSRHSPFGPLSKIISVRPTGMLTEPSDYFYVALTLLILLWFIGGLKKYKRLFVLTLTSMFLTFSTAGFFIGGAFILYALYKNKVKIKYYVFGILAIIPIIIYSLGNLETIYDTQVQQASGASGNLRLNLIKGIINREIEDPLTNYGIYALDDFTYFLTERSAYGREASSVNDAGVLVYLWARMNYLGVFYFIVLAVWQRRISKENLVMFILITLTKIDVFSPLFILYFAFSISQKSFNKLYSNENIPNNTRLIRRRS